MSEPWSSVPSSARSLAGQSHNILQIEESELRFILELNQQALWETGEVLLHLPTENTPQPMPNAAVKGRAKRPAGQERAGMTEWGLAHGRQLQVIK